MISIAVTRKDVAEKAGVSTATVSHVINNSNYVSPELKARVKKAIEELNYTPDFLARSLSTKKTQQVAIAINDITNPYFNEIILGFEEEANRCGYIVNVCIGNNALDRYFNDLYSRHIDGMFLGTLPNKFENQIDKINQLLDNGMVLVTHCNYNAFTGKTSTLRIDYHQGMQEAFAHLTEMGHRKIGFIHYTNKKTAAESLRFNSYKLLINKYRCDFNENYIVFGSTSLKSRYQEGYKYMKTLLARKTDITAVIVANDYMATGALQALEENGDNVPQDMSLVCFDNTLLSKVTRPQLTSINVDQKQQGVNAMNLIDSMIKEDKNHLISEQPTNLIIRGSTAVPNNKR